jgi:hypothetical protein
MVSYLFTVVLSAFLLFLVQPLIGKVVLPWFGGSAAVWTTVLFFFQLVLMLGYGYSFVISAYFNRRQQIFIHTILLVCSFGILLLGLAGDGRPLLPGERLKPNPDASPILHIILILGRSVGLPYFVLSTTGPLLQSWYAKSKLEGSPYWMYALSNMGSFLGLLLYPFVIEPLLTVGTQAWAWSLAYWLFLVSSGYIIYRVSQQKYVQDLPADTAVKKQRKQGNPRRKTSRRTGKTGTIWKYSSLTPEEREYVTRVGNVVQWFLLSMCTTILLAAVTNQITQDVTPMPLLWILPLSIYLISFVITYTLKTSLLRWIIPFLSIATLSIIYGLSQGNLLPIPVQIGIYSAALLTACIAIHSELARLRPELQFLTAYYLIISIGGVLGTVFVGVVAPLVFDSYWELHYGFLFCWIMLLGVLYLDRNSFLHKKHRTLALYSLLIAPVSLFLFTGQYISTFRKTTVLASRNFYGTLRLQELDHVADYDPFYVLSHGSTIHGTQYKPSTLRRIPFAYYGYSSGVGRLLTAINTDNQGKNVGVLGLGVGTLAAYSREQDSYRFYEINPDVIELAEGKEGYLNYLSNAPVDITVVLGDARLSLEKELQSANQPVFDVLVLDVFSSDAIPVHLLTGECFQIYLDLISSDGVIAIHTSTSHINLIPLLSKVADTFSLHAVVIEDAAEGYPCCESRWVLMSKSEEMLSFDSITQVSHPLGKPANNIRMWTDDYSNPLQVLYKD